MVEMHQCAECDTRSENSRGWIVAIHVHGTEGMMFVPLAVSGDPQPGTSRWELCGQACAAKRFSAWFDEWVHPQDRSADRPSTLVLQPPLRRDGTAPWPPPPPDESEAA
jgi:hypothetical protein